MQLYNVFPFELIKKVFFTSLPIMVSIFSTMGLGLVDTIILGHVSPVELAAVAIGGGAYIIVLFGLCGITQAVAPFAGYSYGAKRFLSAGVILQQTIWLTLVLMIPAVLLLIFPAWYLSWTNIPKDVEELTRLYLFLLAFAVPATLLYRTFYAFFGAIGKTKILMIIGICGFIIHCCLATYLTVISDLKLGIVGCAISNIFMSWSELLLTFLWISKNKDIQKFEIFKTYYSPNFKKWKNLLKVGIPISVISVIETSTFVCVTVIIAELGAEVISAYRLMSSFGSLLYTLPFALGITILGEVSQALGEKNNNKIYQLTCISLLFAIIVSVILITTVMLFGETFLRLNTNNQNILFYALPLLPLLASYQLFDALQTIGIYILRAYKITFIPMLIQLGSLWGIGLFCGYFLCFEYNYGIRGFWISMTAALIFTSIIVISLVCYITKKIYNDLTYKQ